MASDPIDDLETAWKAEVPDLETATMATVARLNRFTALLRKAVEKGLVDSGTSIGEFDVLSALRRSGPPYEQMPSTLAKTVMLSPSGMTHRIDLLETAGLVERVANPQSRRTAPVALTELGQAAAEHMARTVISIEQHALANLTKKEQKQLDQLLTKALAGLTA